VQIDFSDRGGWVTMSRRVLDLHQSMVNRINMPVVKIDISR
jgi:hypothetical protein